MSKIFALNEPITARRARSVYLETMGGGGFTGLTGGLQPTIQRCKQGGVFGVPGIGFTWAEVGLGWYDLGYTVGDLDVEGGLKLSITGFGGIDWSDDDYVVRDPYSLRYNIATGGLAGSITLDANASAQADFYKGLIVEIVDGQGAEQARFITGYNGGTKVATVTPNWVTQPNGSSVFRIRASHGQLDAAVIAAIQASLATHADALTIIADVLAIPTNPLLTSDGRLANLDAPISAIPTNPVLTNDARINRLDANITTRATPADAKAIWDELQGSHVVAGSFGELLARPTAAVVANGANTATSFKTNLSLLGVNWTKDSWCVFLDGALKDQVHKVTAFDNVSAFITVENPFTGIPAGASRFALINK